MLVTGVAGFIGFHVAKRLLGDGAIVTGLDNLNDYYDTKLKAARLKELEALSDFTFFKTDVMDRRQMEALFSTNDFDLIVHLAAHVGVRNSVANPHAFVENNVLGFLNILEGARVVSPRHLVFASSSSVYGATVDYPSSESQKADQPVSMYAATKKANELMAHSYASLHRIPITGLRFFTVYGPWGRPDMAYFLFTKAIVEGTPINVFNRGEMMRDFTYVDDIVEGIVRVLEAPPPVDEDNGTDVPCRIYNIGNSEPVSLIAFIEAIENALGRKADMRFKPMQPGDVTTTYADVSKLNAAVGFRPTTSLQDGVQRFVDWYQAYFDVPPIKPD